MTRTFRSPADSYICRANGLACRRAGSGRNRRPDPPASKWTRLAPRRRSCIPICPNAGRSRPARWGILYPEWIPGEHEPSSPIIDMAGLKLMANGTPDSLAARPDRHVRAASRSPAGRQVARYRFRFSSFGGLFRILGGSLRHGFSQCGELESARALSERAKHHPASHSFPVSRLPAGWKLGTRAARREANRRHD